MKLKTGDWVRIKPGVPCWGSKQAVVTATSPYTFLEGYFVAIPGVSEPLYFALREIEDPFRQAIADALKEK